MQYLPISDFNYHLPDDKIAKYPLPDRDLSKLLLFRDNKISEDIFKNLANHLNSNDFVVFNNTKVIQARLLFQKNTGAEIEIFCLEPLNPSDYYQAFQQYESCSWKCLVGNLKKWKTGAVSLTTNINGAKFIIEAEKISNQNEWQEIKFNWNGNYSFGEILENIGHTPIPPYLNRSSEDIDKHRYQTIYSQFNGSVAAPTAGLHFTKVVLNQLRTKKIKTGEITLHVGAGTFKPVKDENAFLHPMHAEHFTVNKQILEQLIIFENHIIAVGTTSLRTLESLYWMGVKNLENIENPFNLKQWDANELPAIYNFKDAVKALINYCETNHLEEFKASTQIMITPGYEFKSVQKLITNFHQPKSTLLLLIAAFIGTENWEFIYNYALENEFRFLSYGDSSLLVR
jgi:S-adenosylmethionine:tRNA ribosyltransferase-isomerase